MRLPRRLVARARPAAAACAGVVAACAAGREGDVVRDAGDVGRGAAQRRSAGGVVRRVAARTAEEGGEPARPPTGVLHSGEAGETNQDLTESVE